MTVPIPPYGFPIDPSTSQTQSSSWSKLSGTFTNILGLSFFASLFSSMHVLDSVRLLVLGTIIETGRRLCQWLIERFHFQYSITAQFDEGDPAYEWIILFLTQENVWRRSRDFRVSAKNSQRKWGIKATEAQTQGNADYVPTFELPRLFRWKGHWIEIKRSKGGQLTSHLGGPVGSTIYLTIYTLSMGVLSALVEEARLQYLEVSRPNLTIHMADMPSYGPAFVWNNIKHKVRRPLSSIILEDGVIDSLVKDALEFIDTEDWYIDAGIPHRRGYLLYGPPGTGKSSTIYAIAGELGLEIYSLSLSSGFVDDGFLQRAASSIPKNSIFLLEDIDCAFPSREDEEDSSVTIPQYSGIMIEPPMGLHGRRSPVTLSGLLNVIDGVGSEEGKLFFATTNYVDRLDPALLRPGRIDRKVEYKLATKKQARALFLRFFPTSSSKALNSAGEKEAFDEAQMQELAEQFTNDVPANEFTTAELQGYLLSSKKQAVQAANGVRYWVERERAERREKEYREERRKLKARDAKERREFNSFQQSAAKYGVEGMMYPSTVQPGGFIGGGAATQSGSSFGSTDQEKVGSILPGAPVTLTPPSSSSTDGQDDESSSGCSLNVDSHSASLLLLMS